MCNVIIHSNRVTQGDVIKWKHFPCYWPFAQGIHRSLVIYPHKGQWRAALIISLICNWTNGWVTIETPVIWDVIAHIMTSLWWITCRHMVERLTERSSEWPDDRASTGYTACRGVNQPKLCVHKISQRSNLWPEKVMWANTFINSHHRYGTNSGNLSSWKTETCIVNIMVVNDLAMQGAMVTPAVVLNYSSWGLNY